MTFYLAAISFSTICTSSALAFQSIEADGHQNLLSISSDDQRQLDTRDDRVKIIRSQTEAGSTVSVEANAHFRDVPAAAGNAIVRNLPDEKREELTDKAWAAMAIDPRITSDQVPNNVAAFEITGAGLGDFNGVYLPSDLQNTAGACTSLTWQMGSGDSLHLLYNMNGAWILDHRGQKPAYNGADDGSCTPETAAWAAVGSTAGSAPTSLVRKTAATFQQAPPGNASDAADAPAAPAQTYFVVSGAGIPGFDGVYYKTPLVVADQRCERTYAKDGPDNTEYTLAFADPLWFFASLIGGQTNRPYIGQDDGSCSPENVVWLASRSGDAPVPAVVRSATATTTTTTTTTTVETTTAPPTSTAAPTVAPVVNTTAAAVQVTTTTAAQTTTTNSDYEVKNDGHMGWSRWWFRLYFPLWLGVLFQAL